MTSTTTLSPKAKTAPAAKRVPQRTCVSCRATSAKRGLVRIVRKPEGAVVVDSSGKQNGRGAYLCARRSCWDDAIKKDRLARSLRATISQNERDALRRYAEGMEPA